MPSSEALPPPARPPVCGMLMPILIGRCWATAPEVSPATAKAIDAPRSVLRFIDPPKCLVFCFILLPPASGLFAPGAADGMVLAGTLELKIARPQATMKPRHIL